jgi:hypothetical protein
VGIDLVSCIVERSWGGLWICRSLYRSEITDEQRENAQVELHHEFHVPDTWNEPGGN